MGDIPPPRSAFKCHFKNTDMLADSGVTTTGNGERGTGNGERETGNGKRETGNGERGTGNGERGTSTGNRKGLHFPVYRARSPIPVPRFSYIRF